MMGSNDDTSNAAAAVAKKAKDADKAKVDRERSEKIQKWVDSTTMDDVVWDDDEAKWILIGSQAKNQKTCLELIKGTAPALLAVPALKKFCVKLQIGNYKNLDKYGMCKHIVGAKKARICKMTCIRQRVVLMRMPRPKREAAARRKRQQNLLV
jgi:hypothetical protein